MMYKLYKNCMKTGIKLLLVRNDYLNDSDFCYCFQDICC